MERAWTPEKYAHSVRRIGYLHATKLGMNAEDREDCASGFLVQMLGTSSAQSPHPLAWLHKCARNYALNFQRTRLHRRETSVPDTDLERIVDCGPPSPAHKGADPLNALLQQERWEQIRREVYDLSVEQQRLLRNYYLEGMSTSALAEREGCSIHAIHIRLSRIRQLLRSALLREEGPDDTVIVHPDRIREYCRRLYFVEVGECISGWISAPWLPQG